MKRIFLSLLALVPLTSCASSLPVERRDYILARPHGWIELTIADSNIPEILSKDEDGKEVRLRPYSCSVVVEVNSELYMDLSVYPDGAQAPFSVQSGFRIPVPTGDHTIELGYRGYRVDPSGERANLQSTMEISVHEDMVTDIAFGNEAFSYVGEVADEEVTLRQIMDALRE
jgi:hypothetical protein